MGAAQSDSLAWDIDIPLLTNRHMLAALAKAMLGAGALVAALVGLLLAVQGQWQAMAAVALWLMTISAGLFLLGLLVMAALFRNRLSSRFAIDDQGVHWTVTDATARRGSRWAFLAGLALGSSAVAGSGLLAASQQRQSLRWAGAFRATAEPTTHSIAFRNGWRTLLRVYCRSDNYAAALERVQREMAAHATAAREPQRSPLGAYLARSLAVVLASLPLLAVGDLLDTGLLLPFVLLCFGLAMV